MFHDANHSSFSTSRLANRLAGYTGDLLGASSWIWRFKHNNLHHGNTNVVGIDADIDQAPFARLAPDQPWRPWHRYQHLYMWVLYGFLTLQWFLFSDFIDLKNHGIGGQRFPRQPRRRDVALLALGKLIHLTWAIAVPLMYHPWWVVLTFYVAISWSVGLLLATMFQLAHCAEPAEFFTADVPRRGPDFVAHQLRTTVDVRCRTRVGRGAAALVDGRARLPGRASPRTAPASHRLPARRQAAEPCLRRATSLDSEPPLTVAGGQVARTLVEDDGYTTLSHKRARPMTDRAGHVRIAEWGHSACSLGVAAISIAGESDGTHTHVLI